jgi:sucrose-6-phosphate hydrolase SacC (GH32 family)
MRSGELEADTGRRILFAWMTNGYWDGADAVVKAPGLPKDSLSLPRDITFAADGRLLQ